MKKIIYKSLASTLVVLVWFLSLQTVNAQTSDNNYKIHGAFAYIQNDPDYAGWAANEDYKQYTCKYCHKTITLQKFIKPGGNAVILKSSSTCPNNHDGDHEFMTETYNIDGSLKENSGLAQNNIKDPVGPELKPEKKIKPSKNLPEDTIQKNNPVPDELTSKPVEPEPKPELIFSIDSLFFDNYFSFYFSAENLISPKRVTTIIRVNNSSGSTPVYEEKFTMTLTPGTNYFVLKPALELKGKIKKDFVVSLYCTSTEDNIVKSYSAQIKDSKKGLFKVFF